MRDNRLCIVVCVIVMGLNIMGCNQRDRPTPSDRSSQRMATETPVTSPHAQSASSHGYEVYFSQVYDADPAKAKANPNNIDKKLVKKLEAAKTSLDAALHEIDSERITTATPHSEYPSMKAMGIPVMQDTNPWSMHHKVITIDGETVVTGSFNFSRNAAETNDENLLILVGNRALAQAYTEEFQRIAGTLGTRRGASAPDGVSATKLNINTATKAELERLPGIGSELADRIINGRPYQSVEDLRQVKGVGPRKLEAILSCRISVK